MGRIRSLWANAFISLAYFVVIGSSSIARANDFLKSSVSSSRSDFISVNSLKEVVYAAQEAVKAGQCHSVSTLFAYDIDNTIRRDSKSSVETEETLAEGKAHAQLVSELSKVGFSTMAVTSRSPLQSVSDLTHSQLKKINFELDPGAILLRHFFSLFKNLPQPEITSDGFFTLNPIFQLNPYNSILYQNGILFTRNTGKGPALKRLLEVSHLNDFYQCLFFVDDLQENLVSIQGAFSNTKMKLALFWAKWYL